MADDRYPIFVKRLDSERALLIHCQSCEWETTITPDQIRNECNYTCPQCGSGADYKYVEADDECSGCGKLGFFSPILHRCCSRVCMLQAEYAEQLKARREAAR